MRHARLALLAASAVLALSACASEPAAWTYAPAPSKTPPPQRRTLRRSQRRGVQRRPDQAAGVKFVETSVDVPAGEAFKIDFDNKDPGTPHDIVIHKGDRERRGRVQGRAHSTA